MTDFTQWCPSIDMGRDREWRLQKAQFGDGYQQRALDGINALKTVWQVSYDNREESEINAMEAYLIARKAHSFPFLDRGDGKTYNVFCDKWNVAYQSVWRDGGTGAVKRRASLSAEFEIANGVTA